MSIKILVVDDDTDVTRLLQTKLEATGRFSVVTALDGKTALALAYVEQPAVVLCDIDMPDMNGGEVAQALARRPETKNIPVIFLSSLVTDREGRDGIKSGGKPIVSKQSAFDLLLKQIDAALTPKSA